MAKLKKYTLGNHGFIRPDLNTALDLPQHVRQASVIAVATSKTHAIRVYAEHGFPNVSIHDSEFRTVNGGNDLDALAGAGLLDEPGVWVLPMLTRPGSPVVRMLPGGTPQRVGRLDGPYHQPVFAPEVKP